jgi:flagellar motor switch protein FliM
MEDIKMSDDTEELLPLDLLASALTPQLRSLLMEGLSEVIMRKVGFFLFQRLRCKVSLLSCVNGVVSHDAALSALPDVMLAGIADLMPLHGRIIISVEGDLIGAVVDEICGSNLSEPFLREELSTMETRIGKQMIELTADAMAEVISTLTPLKIRVAQYETSTAMLSVAEGQAWMISTTGIYETVLGFGSIRVIIPYAAFEPLEARVVAQSGLIAPRVEDHSWVDALHKLTDGTLVELRLEIARSQVSIGVFESLRPGDILPFFLLPEAVGVAGGIDLFHADYGQSKGFVCFRPIFENSEPAAAAAPGEAKNGLQMMHVHPEETSKPKAGSRTTRERAGMNAVDRVTVAVTVQLGTIDISLKNLRQWRQGQVILLDQMTGEPLGIFANGHLLAFGEVVSVGKDQYSIRVTSLAAGKADGG